MKKGILLTIILGGIIIFDLIFKTSISLYVSIFIIGMMFEKGVLLWQLAKDANFALWVPLISVLWYR